LQNGGIMKRRKSETLAEINITSLVDVALVLLIVFMIAAPFIRAGTKVVLPKAETREKHPKESMIIFVNQIGQVYFDGQNMTDAELKQRLERIYADSPDANVLLEGDVDAAYGRITTVIDAVRQAGYENVGLVLDKLER